MAPIHKSQIISKYEEKIRQGKKFRNLRLRKSEIFKIKLNPTWKQLKLIFHQYSNASIKFSDMLKNGRDKLYFSGVGRKSLSLEPNHKIFLSKNVW